MHPCAETRIVARVEKVDWQGFRGFGSFKVSTKEKGSQMHQVGPHGSLGILDRVIGYFCIVPARPRSGDRSRGTNRVVHATAEQVPSRCSGQALRFAQDDKRFGFSFFIRNP